MAINDPVEVKYNERRESYYLLQGNETFYDDDNVFREWMLPEHAYEWAKKNLLHNEIIMEI